MLNMAALVSFGPIIALAMGRGLQPALLFLIFFFACAIGGAVAQILWFSISNTDGLAIGASSAISGLLPAVGYIRGGRKTAWSISVPWIVINIVLAFVGGFGPIGIAWAAHLGGLAAGFSFPFFLALARR